MSLSVDRLNSENRLVRFQDLFGNHLIGVLGELTSVTDRRGVVPLECA